MTDADRVKQNQFLVRADRLTCSEDHCGLRHIPRGLRERERREPRCDVLSYYSKDAEGSGVVVLTPEQQYGFATCAPATKRGARGVQYLTAKRSQV